MMKNHVLIIDDEELIRSTTLLLLDRKGFEARITVNGKEGIIVARQWKPDLILLDIVMPVMNGWEVMKELRSDVKTKDIPVIITTAMDSVIPDELVLKRGAQAIINKPFQLQELLSIVDRVLTGK
jgi:CheY-like chemotaxis protein